MRRRCTILVEDDSKLSSPCLRLSNSIRWDIEKLIETLTKRLAYIWMEE